MLFRKFITAVVLLLAGLVTPATISESTIYRGEFDFTILGPLTIDGTGGTYLSIVDVSLVSLGSLTVDSANLFYVTVVNALSSIVNISGSLANSGTVSFLTGVTYTLGSITNNAGGTMYFAGSGSGATMGAITNSGQMCFYNSVTFSSTCLLYTSRCV